MYVPEIVVGVVGTLLVEMLLVFAYSLHAVLKSREEEEGNDDGY